MIKAEGLYCSMISAGNVLYIIILVGGTLVYASMEFYAVFSIT